MIDRGIRYTVIRFVKGLVGSYCISLDKKIERDAVIVYTVNYFDRKSDDDVDVRLNVIDTLAEYFKLSKRTIRLSLRPKGRDFFEIDRMINSWNYDVFKEGDTYYVRDDMWYRRNFNFLKHIKLIDNKGRWKKKIYADRLAYCGKPVYIASINGNRIRIAQDCGFNTWNALELMGEASYDEVEENSVEEQKDTER